MELKIFLYEKDLTITKAAEILGITPHYLSQIIKGRIPGPRLQYKIDKLLGKI